MAKNWSTSRRVRGRTHKSLALAKDRFGARITDFRWISREGGALNECADGGRIKRLSASPDVCFEAHCGLKSDIVLGPKSANMRQR
jgi:hypothetical protein